MAREPSRRFITNIVNFASKPWNVAGREVQELIRKLLESDQEGRPAEHRLLDPISHQDTERDDPTDGAVIRGDGTNWKVADAVTVFDEADPAVTGGFLNVTGTLPAVPTSTAFGAGDFITSAGSAAIVQVARTVIFYSGYTGAAGSAGIYLENHADGTETVIDGGAGGVHGNNGIYSFVANSSVGTSVGVQGRVGSTQGSGIGVFGRATNGPGTVP
jgi:hypothetical protein